MSDLTARLRLTASGGTEAAAEVGKVDQALDRTATSAEQADREARQAAAGIDQLGRSAQGAARHLDSLYDEQQLDFVTLYNKQMGQAAVANDNAGRAARLHGHEVTNLGRQFADVGVMAAMGMNPMMILVSQGPQIADIFATAGARGMSFGAVMKDVGRMVAPIAPALLGIGAVAGVAFGAAGLAARALNKENGDLTKGMGLTEAQLKRLKDQGVDTGVTIGDVFKGTYNYIAKGVGEALAPVTKFMSSMLDGLTRMVVNYADNFVGLMYASVKTVIVHWREFPKVVGTLFVAFANATIGNIESIVNAAIKGLNLVAQLANKVPGVRVGTAGEVKFGRLTQADNNVTADFARWENEGREWMARQRGALGRSIREAGRDRIGEDAGDAGKERGARGRSIRDTSDERLAQVMAELERAKADELQAQLALTRDVRERQRLETEILKAQTTAKQEQIQGQIARIRDDKGLTAAKKAELIEQLWLVSLLQDSAAGYQQRLIDERADQAIARQKLEISQAQRQNQIDLLGSQAQLAKSGFRRAQIEVQILEQQHAMERERLQNITQAAGYSADEVEVARARLGVLEQIQANELAQANAQTELLDAITEAADAVRGFKSAFGRGDFQGALNNLLATIETISGAIQQYGAMGGLTSIGSAVASAVGGRTGRAIGGGLGLAGMGIGLGSYLASGGLAAGVANGVIGLGGSVALAGGLGSGIMAIGSMMGPIAVAAGALYAAAKLLNVGGKPTNAGAGYDLVTGQLSGNKRTSETENAAKGAADAITSIQDALKEAGITLPQTVKGLVIGTRDLTQIYLSNGQTITSAVGDAAAAADAALKAVLQGATYVSDAQKNLVEGMLAAGKGFDDISAALQGYAAAQTIPQQIADAILQLTDPKAWALEELKRAQKEQRDALLAAKDAGYLTQAQYEAAAADLARLEELQLAEVLERFADAVDESIEALAAQAGALTKSVSDRILELTDPHAYKVKRINDQIDAQREEALKLIEAGVLDGGILEQLERLRTLELAELAGAVTDITKVFEQARPKLLAWLDQVKIGPSAELSPKAAAAEALRQYEAMYARARSGDAEALANITSYADRALASDRTATSSAQQRLALSNRIQAEIAALAGMGGASKSPAAAMDAMSGSLKTIAETSIVQLKAAMQADAEGGQRVLVSNLPAIRDLYAGALADQTSLLVAANDRTREEVVAQLQALGEQLAAAIAALQSAVQSGLEVNSEHLAEAAALLEQVRSAQADLADEARKQGVWDRAQEARR